MWVPQNSNSLVTQRAHFSNVILSRVDWGQVALICGIMLAEGILKVVFPGAAPVIMIISGAVLEGGLEVYKQLQRGEKINWGPVLIRAAGGGIKSAFCLPGVGPVGAFIGVGVTGGVSEYCCRAIQGDGSINAIADSALQGLFEGASVGLLKYVGKKMNARKAIKAKENPRAPRSNLRQMSEEELEKISGGAKDPNWKPGSGNSKPKGSGGLTPVSEKVISKKNGLPFESNSKHTPGASGCRPNAGIEPRNSFELFEDSVVSSKKPGARYAFDKETKTLHRFFSDGNGTWHWSGSTNQGANSLSSNEVPVDIIRMFDLPRKGW